MSQRRQTCFLVFTHLLYADLLHRINNSFHILLGATDVSPVIVQLVTNVQKRDRGRVSINVYQDPEGPPRFDAAEEDAFLFTVDAEVNVSGRVDVVEQDGVLAAEALGQCLCPVARLVGEIGAGILRETVAEGAGVVVGEAKADNAAPIV